MGMEWMEWMDKWILRCRIFKTCKGSPEKDKRREDEDEDEDEKDHDIKDKPFWIQCMTIIRHVLIHGMTVMKLDSVS